MIRKKPYWLEHKGYMVYTDDIKEVSCMVDPKWTSQEIDQKKAHLVKTFNKNFRKGGFKEPKIDYSIIGLDI